MLLDSGSDPGFRDGARGPGGVSESAALGGASLPDSAGTDHLCGERIRRGTGDDGASLLPGFNCPCAVKPHQRVEKHTSVKARIRCELVLVQCFYRSVVLFHMCCDFEALPTTFSNL